MSHSLPTFRQNAGDLAQESQEGGEVEFIKIHTAEGSSPMGIQVDYASHFDQEEAPC